jgi:hypothetical protein
MFVRNEPICKKSCKLAKALTTREVGVIINNQNTDLNGMVVILPWMDSMDVPRLITIGNINNNHRYRNPQTTWRPIPEDFEVQVVDVELVIKGDISGIINT